MPIMERPHPLKTDVKSLLYCQQFSCTCTDCLEILQAGVLTSLKRVSFENSLPVKMSDSWLKCKLALASNDAQI